MNINFIKRKVKDYLDDENRITEEALYQIFKDYSNEDKEEIVKVLYNCGVTIGGNGKKKLKKLHSNDLINLTNEQLCALYQKGNKVALDTLLEKNKNLIYSRVKKFIKTYNHRLEEEDLFQYGVIGFITSVEKFNGSMEAKLTTYTVHWIDQAIRRAIADFGFTIRIPVHMFESVGKLRGIMLKNPTLGLEELRIKASEEGIESNKFDMIRNILSNIINLTSLNTFVGEDGESELGEFLPNEDESYNVESTIINDSLREALNNALATLSEKESDIIKYRVGFDNGQPMTLEKVGEKYKVTRERIRQIEAKALRRLRHPSRSKGLKVYYMED